MDLRINPFAGCKKCKSEVHTSLIEQTLFYYIRIAFTDAQNRYIYSFEEKKKIEFDIYIPSIKTAIEYDGFFHNPESSIKNDQLKNSICQEQSIQLIRIRETRLPALSPEAKHTIPFKYSPKSKVINSLVEQVIRVLQTIQPVSFDSSMIQFESDQVKIMNAFVYRQKENSLLKLYPELAKEWHQTKNQNLQPDMFMPTSQVWWQCKDNPAHEWPAIISNRSHLKHGCPYCANQMVTKETSFAYRYPDLVKLWHPFKNLSLRPEEVFPGTSQKVWWVCSNKHEHEMSVSKKVARPTSCSDCNGKKVNEENAFSILHPNLLKEWHPTLNDKVLPNEVTAGSTKIVWWQCSKNPKHEWKASVNKRVNGRNCPYCANKKVLPEESLASKRPDLMRQWHLTNSISPEKLREKSNRKVWWICIENPEHEWQAVISSRRKATCPECQNKKVTARNCLATTHPYLITAWDVNKNTLSPYEVVAGSGKKIWFLCEQQHPTYETVWQFVKRGGCSICHKSKKKQT
ncbi:zinc-ribbon domain-containing protein [Psychrobacillus sp. PGGUH221]|uniref:zinc-ribbon domain-containing protein n=1 Tax=Psychrobacillus sp. PGGUH221 TaxID=3020058 RepID=UPI0035C725E8